MPNFIVIPLFPFLHYLLNTLFNSKYTVISLSIYYIATILAIGFCLFAILFQYGNLSELYDKVALLWLIPCLFLIIDIFIFAYISINAKKMYEISIQHSLDKRKLRNLKVGENKKIYKRDIAKAIIYFIYPKKKDLQKSMLIIIGFLMGIFLLNLSESIKPLISIELIRMYLIRIGLAWIIIDFLLYQARYQWNDIRGLKEDIKSGKNDRLPIKIWGERKTVILSLVILLSKIFLAILITFFVEDIIKFPLRVSIALIICSAFIYEFVRAKNKVSGILIFVSIGYPLRLLAGIWTAYPNLWKDYFVPVFKMFSNGMTDRKILIFPVTFLLLLCTYIGLGGFSAIIPWIYEAIYQKKTKNNIVKEHYRYLFFKFEERYERYLEENGIINFFPLREQGKIYDIWNIYYIISIILISIALIINYTTLYCLILEIVVVIFSVFMCISSYKKIFFCSVITSIFIITKAIYCLFNIMQYQFYIFFCLNQIFIIWIYYFLRCKFNPSLILLNFV